jgi:hypothetical protein
LNPAYYWWFFLRIADIGLIASVIPVCEEPFR